ncbi:MAG: family metallopeptidase [Paenibacillaceae bacterium]|jgi:murein DD-endopeptidase MepM/ murein hydrolase activator NlpD|nr:family metallopeptidase [Paenibacillaceae bacterium]
MVAKTGVPDWTVRLFLKKAEEESIMTGFKMKVWFLERLSQVKSWGKPLKISLKRMTGAIIRLIGTIRNNEHLHIWLQKIRERSAELIKRAGTVATIAARKMAGTGGKSATALGMISGKSASMLGGVFRRYRIHMLGTLGLAAVIWTGSLGYQQYVEAHTYDIYHVYVNDQYAGTVSNPQVVDEFKIAKYKEVQESNPEVHMVLNTDEIILKGEKAYKGLSDDAAALAQLDQLLTSHAVGVELIVDGKVVGIVKDKDTADQLLNQVKAKYGGAAVAEKQDAEKGRVSILSASETKELNPGESEVQKVDFVQQVDTKLKEIDPAELVDPDVLLAKLETGDVQPTKYTVVKGDSISRIAQNFNISRQVIYENNPWIVDDAIKIGQVMDLTVLQPTLSVKTVEKVVESEEIQYETDYVLDDSLRAGTIQTIKPGINGLKNVTFLVTKINGKWMEEEMLDEEILQDPVKAQARKGTKVVLGEGTGKFAWPVVSSSISSGYGYRWGKLHKGIDLTGNKAIRASDNGKVEYVGYKSDYGNHIIITHLNGYKTLYGHLSASSVKVGQIVEKGERIGTMGSTGDSTGTHLHFEIIRNGAVENPLKYLNR